MRDGFPKPFQANTTCYVLVHTSFPILSSGALIDSVLEQFFLDFRLFYSGTCALYRDEQHFNRQLYCGAPAMPFLKLCMPAIFLFSHNDICWETSSANVSQALFIEMCNLATRLLGPPKGRELEAKLNDVPAYYISVSAMSSPTGLNFHLPPNTAWNSDMRHVF